VDSERWQLLERLFHGALEREGEDRLTFLAEVCAEDTYLRQQIEALLTAHESAADFIEHPPQDQAAKALCAYEDTPYIHQQIGSYLVLSLLGKGGMGEVYLAQDTRLGRKVALKFLPAQLTRNTEQLLRFEREARAASALNHPNILTVHHIGQHGTTHFIATEYIEGATLRERMGASKLGLKEALDITIQIANALSAALEEGIIHRDIKPENIMIRRDGYVKVLDFGLAKLAERHGTPGSGQAVSLDTESGMVIGTITYMSPEQALGREVDHRTDLFSLGVVLYEMVTGAPPFKKSTVAATFDALLNHAPNPVTEADPALPMELERIIARTLEKDRELRFQTASDLRVELSRLKRDLDSETLLVTSSWARLKKPFTGRSIQKASLVAALVVVLAISSYLLLRPRDKKEVRGPDWSNATSTPITTQPGEEIFPSLSPDGKWLVYASRATGNWDIYRQRVGGQTPMNLTEDSTADDNHPAFSPDGELIAFRSERDGGGIFIMGATGENIRRLTEPGEDAGYNPSWSPDGSEILCTKARTKDPANRSVIPSRLWAVNVATSEKRTVTEGDAVQATWSPHGHRIAYWGLHKGGQRDLWTIPAAGGQPVPVMNDDATDWNPVWSPEGNYLYFASDRGGSMNLWRVPIEEESGRVLGQPEPVRTPSSYSQHITFSRDGRQIIYVNAFGNTNIRRAVFDPVRERVVGQPVWITRGARQMSDLDLSPDGRWLVFSSQGETQEDLILIRSDGSGTPRHLTNDVHRDRGPRFSPDGSQVAFYSNRGGGKFDIWTINTDGSGLRQITQSTTATVFNPVWSPDGTRIAYTLLRANAFIMDLRTPWTEQTPTPLPAMSNPDLRLIPWSWSSDGKALAGWQIRIGQPHLGIVLYAPESQEYEQLTDFGTRPTWLSDNRRLLFYYVDDLYLVDSNSKGAPRKLLSTQPNEIIGMAIVRDDRSMYFSVRVAEADIWMMSLD
jgi:Tol biopolymer transport system component